jgi:O-antigen/teichoic acid export membrane protein
MSSVVGVIEPSEPAIVPPPTVVETDTGLRRLFTRNFWALSDQVMISGTNFATMVLIARAFGDRQADFGTFSVIYGIYLWCNIFQGTLVSQAHNVLGATRSGDDYRRYTTSTALEQLIMVALEAALTIPIAIFAYCLGWSSWALLVALVPTIIAWQLQEFVRRVLYTEGRYLDAFLNDVISYGGQTLVIVGLYFASAHGGPKFSGVAALYALAATSAAGAILGAWQIRRSLSRGFSWADLKENWHFGKWLAGGELLNWCSSIHMMVWWAALLIGVVASADLRAAQILFGPMRVITFFLDTVLPTRFARKLHREGPAAMHRNVRSVYLILAPSVGLYCLALAIFPKPLLTLMFDAKYAASAAMILKLYSLCAFLTYMQRVVVAALSAARQTRYIFAGSVIGCVVALVMGPLMIYQFHAAGAIISMILTSLIVMILYYRAYLQQHEMQGVAVIDKREQG